MKKNELDIYLLEHGYKVEATDGSEELCRLASEYTGIKVRNEADWADYDYLNFPWYPDGEVWDTGVTIEKNTNYKEVAEWLLKEYPYIVKAHENGEIYYYSEEEEND